MALSAKGFDLASKGVEEITKNASKIYEEVRGSFKTLSQEMEIMCPEEVQRISLAFEAKGGILPKKIRFPFGKPIYVSLRGITGMQDIGTSVSTTDDGFEIETSKMKGTDTYILNVEYKSKCEGFINDLVQRDAAKEVPKDRESEYWLHAELRHPKVLKTKYGKLDLRDVDFNVNVGISEDIKMVIPGELRYELDLGVKLLNEREPHKKAQLAKAHSLAMSNRGPTRDITDILRDIQELFIPATFSRYLDVSKDFHYYKCERGMDFYDKLPYLTWPRSMTVVSRTDLNLDKFASEGIVKYKKVDLMEKLEKMIEKHRPSDVPKQNPKQ
jgi:hypothetical protein